MVVETGLIHAEWREYRDTSMPRGTTPSSLRWARLAYFAAVSMVLAKLVPRIAPGDLDDETLEMVGAMAEELGAFVATESRAGAPSP